MNLDGGSESIPLWLLYENEIEAWRAAQMPQVARWISEQNFKGEKHRVVLLPDSAGGLTGAVGGLFQKAFHYFNLHRETFLTHYHKRSNVESAIMSIKTKFGDSVRSKTDRAMRNEVLCKILCHNICCLTTGDLTLNSLAIIF